MALYFSLTATTDSTCLPTVRWTQRDPEVPSERDFARRLRRIRSRSWHFQTGPPTGGSDQELQTRDFRDGSSTIELACEIGF